MATTKKYYKVVDENLQSVMGKHKALPANLIVQYKIGEFVSPNMAGTSLMVFSDLDSAIDFAINYDHIYEVEIKNPRKVAPFVQYIGTWNDYGRYMFSQLQKLLSCRKQHKNYTRQINTGSIPKNTVFCQQVKLIRRVN